MTTNEELLHAYHDGELSWLARWRFERRLRHSPELRAELDQLRDLRGLLRSHDAAEPTPDLWDAIALRLPAADARREPERGDAGARGASVGLVAGGLWWLKPAGAVAATAAVAAIVLYGGPWQEAPASTGGVVRWIDSGERSVMVLDDQPDTTIIWVLDTGAEGAWMGGRRDEA